jgi:hypothetical protein
MKLLKGVKIMNSFKVLMKINWVKNKNFSKIIVNSPENMFKILKLFDLVTEKLSLI